MNFIRVANCELNVSSPYVETLSSLITVFGEGVSEKVFKVKRGHKGIF